MNGMKALFFRDFKNDYIPEVIKETWIERLYAPYIKKDSIVAEVGANVGIFTLYAYEFAKKVYAVEPSKRHFETLTTMLGYNEMFDKVVPLNYAIGGENGTLKLYHNENSTMYSLHDIVAPKKDDFEEVPVKTLKTFMEEEKLEHIDLLNLDVEGEEMKIIASSEFDEVAPKIDTIVVEWHNWTSISPHILSSALRDRGFTVTQPQTSATVFIGTK